MESIEGKEVIYELGTMVSDKYTGLKGMLTHFQYGGDHVAVYLFQPQGLNPEDGQPVKSYFIPPEHIEGGTRIIAPYLALEVLGTEVED